MSDGVGIASKLSLKRRREYQDDEEVEVARERLRHMALSRTFNHKEGTEIGDVVMGSEIH